MPTNRRGLLCVGIAMALVLSAGCSDTNGSRPQVLPSQRKATTQASATPKVSGPTPTVNVNLVSLTRSYYLAVNSAIDRAEASKLRSYSLATCPCRELADFVHRGTDGSHVRGGHIHLRRATVRRVNNTEAAVDVTYDVAPGAVVSAHGKRRKSFVAVTGARDEIVYKRVAGMWLIRVIVQLNA